MTSIKNHTFLKAALLASILSSFSTKAFATDYVVNSKTTSRYTLNNGDNLLVTASGSIEDPGLGVILSGASANSITNNGCIYSDGSRGHNCNTNSVNVNNDAVTIVIQNNAHLNTLTNNGSIGRSITVGSNVSDNTSVGIINNTGYIYEDINVQKGSTVGIIRNSGIIGDDIDIIDNARVTEITNTSNGFVSDKIQIHNNPNYTAHVQVGTLNNFGTIKNKIHIHEADITTVNNTGNILSSEYLTNAATNGILIQGSNITTLNNSGNILGDILIEHDVHLILGTTVVDDIVNPQESIITALNNSGYIRGGINMIDGSKIIELDNNDNGRISGINLNDNSEIITIANNDNALIDGINLKNNSKITKLDNNLGAGITEVNLDNSSKLGTLNNYSLINQVALRDSSQITSQLNNYCGAEIDTVSVSNNSQIPAINNYSYIGNILVKDSGKITNLTNSFNCTTPAQINLVNLEGIANIATLDNNSGSITEIKLDGDSTVDTLNNNSGSTIETVNLNNNSKITNLNNDAIIDEINARDNSEITNLNNNSTLNAINLYDESSINDLNNEAGATLGEVNLFDNSQIATPLDNYGLIEQVSLSGNSTIPQLNNHCDAQINSVALDDNSLISQLNNDAIIGQIAINGSAKIGSLNNNNNTDCENPAVIGSINFDGPSELTTLNNDSVIGRINLNNGATVNNINNNNSGTIQSIALTNGSEGNINNLGTIYNDEGIAISSDATSNININNTGFIYGSEKAIDYGNGSNNLLTLNPGSTITGLIDFGNQDSNEVTVTGGYQETRHYAYEGDFQLNPYDTERVLVIINEDEFIVTNRPKVNDEIIKDIAVDSSNDINNLISSRLDSFRFNSQCDSRIFEERCIDKKLASNEVKVASNNYSNLDIDFSGEKALFWTEAFGSYQERSSYKSNGGSETSSGGLILGIDKKISQNQRLGGFVGALSGSSHINRDGLNVVSSIDSEGFFTGGYLSTNNKSYFTDLSLIIGYMNNNSDRIVNTGDIAQSSFNNIFAAPTLTVGKVVTLPKVNLPVIVSAALRYTGQWIEGGEETGSSANVTTDNKYLNTISTRLKVETNNKGGEIFGANFSVNFRTGLEANRMVGSQNSDITIFDEKVTLISNNRKYNIDGFVGVNTTYDLKDNLRIYADIEGSKGISKTLSNNTLGLQGKLGLKYAF